MLKTIGLLSILPMLSFAFFIPFPVSVSVQQENNNTVIFESKNFQVNNNEEKICPFIEFVDKELCNTTTKDITINMKEDFNKLNLELDPKDLCPLLDLVDKSFCKSSKNLKTNTRVIRWPVENYKRSQEELEDPLPYNNRVDWIKTRALSFGTL